MIKKHVKKHKKKYVVMLWIAFALFVGVGIFAQLYEIKWLWDVAHEFFMGIAAFLFITAIIGTGVSRVI